MEYVKLNNGIMMPVLGLGTYEGTDIKTAEQSVRSAIDLGYRLIDTAQYYGNEKLIGKALKESAVDRNEIFLTSKIWFNRFEECYDAVLESLRNLQTEYLDLILLHWPFGNTYKAYRDLERLYSEGKVRAIGVSNFHADRLIDIDRYNDVTPAVDQIETNLLCQQKIDHAYMKRMGVAHQSYSPFGQGRINDLFNDSRLLEMAERYGKSTRQIALRFHLQEDVLVIPKTINPERMAQNIDVFDFSLTEADMDILRSFDTGHACAADPADPADVIGADKW